MQVSKLFYSKFDAKSESEIRFLKNCKKNLKKSKKPIINYFFALNPSEPNI
jgi:hypothetical protein